NQLFQTCLDPQGSFGGPSDVIVLLWRLEDLMLDEITAFAGGDACAVRRAGEKLDALVGAFRQLRRNFSGMVVVGVPPYPTGPSANVWALNNAGTLGAFHRTLVGQFADEMGRTEGVYLVDLDAVQRQVGIVASDDARYRYLYRQPFSDLFLHTLGR